MEVLRKVKFNGGGATHRLNKGFSAFTLAEMMVVMLIMSIVLAAMAPVMTTKNKVDNSSPWKYSPNNSSDAYFGQGASMRAMIGQLNGEDTDNGKLVINSLGSSFSHILFKNGNTILGDLYMSGNNLILGQRNGSSTSLGQNNINIGPKNWPSTDITGQSNIIIGDNAMTHLSTGSNNIGLGTTLTALTTGTGNVTIGDNSLIGVTTGSGNIGLGNEANPAITTVSKTIAIGANSVASSVGAIAIGSSYTASESNSQAENSAIAGGGNSIAIGSGAISAADTSLGVNGGSIAIGWQAKANPDADADGNMAVAIGTSAEAKGTGAVALGTGAMATGGSIAIGAAQAPGTHSIAMGMYSDYGSRDNDGYTESAGRDSIALGTGAYAAGVSSIAIGNDSYASSNHGIAIGYNAEAKDEAIAIGKDAYISRLNGGIAIGAGARSGATDSNMYGDYAIAIGKNAKAGSDNGVSLGYNAGSSTKGYNNTAIGAGACQYVTGSNKTCIGANSGPTSSNGSDWAKDDKERIFIGSQSKFNAAPAVLEVHNEGGASFGRNKDSSVVINGNLIVKGGIISTLWRYGGGDNDNVNLLARSSGQLEPEWNDTVAKLFERYSDNGHGKFKSFSGNVISDRRLKYVGKESTTGLDKVRQLKVFNFTYKKDTTKTPHVGVIAQDLQKVFPNAVQKGKDGFLTIRMEDMFYAVINAIKELDAKITALQKENQELKQLVKQVQEDNKCLDQRLQKLEAKQK